MGFAGSTQVAHRVILVSKALVSTIVAMALPDSITVHINGEARQCPPSLPLPELLQTLGMNPRLVAVEYNGEILHRQFWDETLIQQSDRLEIVTIVGGG